MPAIGRHASIAIGDDERQSVGMSQLALTICPIPSIILSRSRRLGSTRYAGIWVSKSILCTVRCAMMNVDADHPRPVPAAFALVDHLPAEPLSDRSRHANLRAIARVHIRESRSTSRDILPAVVLAVHPVYNVLRATA